MSKAPFIAAKNVFYPDKKEIASLEYYIENFVWGGLQRTDKEIPYPYGIYGTPNWDVNRDPEKRKLITRDKNQDKEHIWRSYDYPHIMMLYWHMYQIASDYPEMVSYLDKEGYLERAKETAKAYFIYPYEILPWYETYKWGCYNELLIPEIIDELKKKGFKEDAEFLTLEWEKKAKYFIYDDKYPFRSEYAVDATAYESTHALAKYAVQHKMKPDVNLWFDKNFNKWYSHPEINDGDASDFMERQMDANIAVRGWVEPTFYYQGSDFRGKSDKYNLSYMAQMGGWAVLDYGLHYAQNKPSYIQLGYASYLSSFALINSGTTASNYGYWYPGKQNDGAAGWAFEPLKYTRTWLQREHGRGVWYYDGEIDLGFCGATRMAATVLTEDPVFGILAYGGDLKQNGNVLAVVPKDGLRRRLNYRMNDKAIDVELFRDGFAVDQPVLLDPVVQGISFNLENRTANSHNTRFMINGFEPGEYSLVIDGKMIETLSFKGASDEVLVKVINPKYTRVEIRKK